MGRKKKKDESESPPDVIEETVDGQRNAIDAFKEELEAAEGTEMNDDRCVG